MSLRNLIFLSAYLGTAGLPTLVHSRPNLLPEVPLDLAEQIRVDRTFLSDSHQFDFALRTYDHRAVSEAAMLLLHASWFRLHASERIDPVLATFIVRGLPPSMQLGHYTFTGGSLCLDSEVLREFTSSFRRDPGRTESRLVTLGLIGPRTSSHSKTRRPANLGTTSSRQEMIWPIALWEQVVLTHMIREGDSFEVQDLTTSDLERLPEPLQSFYRTAGTESGLSSTQLQKHLNAHYLFQTLPFSLTPATQAALIEVFADDFIDLQVVIPSVSIMESHVNALPANERIQWLSIAAELLYSQLLHSTRPIPAGTSFRWVPRSRANKWSRKILSEAVAPTDYISHQLLEERSKLNSRTLKTLAGLLEITEKFAASGNSLGEQE